MNRSLAGVLNLVALLLCVSTLGCSNELPKETLDQTQSAITTALESWKKGEPVAKLKDLSPPIDFHDEDRNRGFKLINYEISKTEGQVSELPHSWVKLTLKDRQGKTIEKYIVYQMKEGPTIIIARDPYR